MKALNKRGQTAGLIGAASAIAAVCILLFFTLLLLSKVRSSIDRGDFSTDDNDTYDEVVGNSNTAIKLVAIGLIVLVAVVIIAFLRGGLG